MARSLFTRKLVTAAATAAVVFSAGAFTGGYYIYGQENASTLDANPQIITISVQQSCELVVEKQAPDGSTVPLDDASIRWSFSSGNIARVDGARIYGLNAGETELIGRYRNKEIELKIRVTEPMNGIVDISQRYQQGLTVRLYAGTEEREHRDGALRDAEFVSPESIAVAEDGTVYVSDAGLLRRIRGNTAETIQLDPAYITVNLVRCYKNEVYALTNAWEEDGEIYYGIIRLTDNRAELLFTTNATYSAIEDFAFSKDGVLYFIDRNEGAGVTALRTLNPNDPQDFQTLCGLPSGTSSLAIDERGAVYLANSETGVIQLYYNETLSYFAGVENEKAFVDGFAPLFYMPQRIKYSDGALYVWDFNVLRRISIADGAAQETVTIAGEASPSFDQNIARADEAAERIILPNSRLTDFEIKGSGMLLSDPKRGVIWRVELIKSN